MADLDFENPTFDPDGPGIDDDYSFDPPPLPRRHYGPTPAARPAGA